ncbi:MAG: phage holin family protein [Polyangiales bacterium]
MSDPVMKFQIIARAEMALFHIRAQRVAGRSTLFVVATVLGLLALGMLDFAAFSAMSPSQGPALAALYMALGNAVAAGLLIMAARKAGPSESHEKLAIQIRDLAYMELSRDIEQVQTEIQDTVKEVRHLRSSIQSVGSLIGVVSKLTSGD